MKTTLILSRQPWLLPYQNPLQERIGASFFKSLPPSPGIYLMRGVEKEILYIGKSKNLKNRIRSYRNLKPEEAPRKLVRLVNLIRNIDFEVCPSEEHALLRENELLRKHRPPFNFMNKRPDSYYFIGVGKSQGLLHLKLTTEPLQSQLMDPHWNLYGAYRGRGQTKRAYAALLRLLWAAGEHERKNIRFPTLLLRRRPPSEYALPLPHASWLKPLEKYLIGKSRKLLNELTEKVLELDQLPPYLYNVIQEDLEELKLFFRTGPNRIQKLRKFHKIKATQIDQMEIDDLLVLYRAGKRKSDFEDH